MEGHLSQVITVILINPSMRFLITETMKINYSRILNKIVISLPFNASKKQQT